jgi:hypothetical protein
MESLAATILEAVITMAINVQMFRGLTLYLLNYDLLTTVFNLFDYQEGDSILLRRSDNS